MDDTLARLFNNFDRGVITRRQLLQVLGIAAVGAPLAGALGQGRCGGARAGTPECDTTPLPPPFEPTGWNTVYMDHFTLQTADYQKEAAFFTNLMGWKVHSVSATSVTLQLQDRTVKLLLYPQR